MEIIVGPGAPAWDELGTEETDMWTVVSKVHMQAARPPTPEQRQTIIQRFIQKGAPPLVLEAASWRALVPEPAPVPARRPP